MQLSLLDSHRRAVPTVQRATVRVPEFEEALDYDDEGSQLTVAEYRLTMQSPHWDRCRSGVWVSLGRHKGWKPHRWMVDWQIELPDLERTGWHGYRIFLTQEEAASEAADIARAGRALLLRAIFRGVYETPGRRRGRAAEAAADADPRFQQAQDVVTTKRAALDEAQAAGEWSAWHGAAVAWHEAKAQAARVRQLALDEFYAAHDWREWAQDLLTGGGW